MSAIPTGYVLVPIEPTRAMLAAWNPCIEQFLPLRITWPALLKAAASEISNAKDYGGAA